MIRFRTALAASTVITSSLFFTVAFVLSFFLTSRIAMAEDVNAVEVLDSFTESYCNDCHQADNADGGFDLTAIDFATTFRSWVKDPDSQPETADAIEHVVSRLRSRQMPPSDADRPSESEYNAIVELLTSRLDARYDRSPNPGRTDPVRRLSRTEYQNAIRDLVGVEIDASDWLPADQSGHGFDNVTVGSLSPALISRYLSAASKISRLAVGGPQPNPGGRSIRLPADLTQESHVDGLPLGTRGGALVRHHFPVGGQYEIQLRLMRDRDENLEGLTGKHDIHFLVDQAREHVFTVEPPNGKGKWGKDDTLVDANLKKRFTVTAGPHDLGVTFPHRSYSIAEIKRQPFEASFNRHRHPRKSPAIFEISIVGPFDQDIDPANDSTPSRNRIFVCRPESADQAESCAIRILESLMRVAYRRSTSTEDLKIPLQFFRQRFAAERDRKSDDSTLSRNDQLQLRFNRGIESALAAVLVNPHFLLRAESESTDQAIANQRISDFELASRLSFFLWGSLPDDELLSCAESETLSDPKVLSDQVARMLGDKRSENLVTNFAAQWLYLRNLDSFRPDMRLFPNFDDNLRKSMRRETELLFADVMRRDASVLELIDSDATFLNERLAGHYDIRGVVGSHFRKVTLPQDSKRGGLLRHASILSVTSYATRTSPTIRGSWVLENIFGTPPPPPPPNVPSLKEKSEAAKLTVRQRLAQHRANPACASCHDLIDPVGFALEHYDSVGRLRVFDDGQKIDSSGLTPDGRAIGSVADLEGEVLKRPELFVSALTEKLMTFALGRGIQRSDQPAIRAIVRDAEQQDFKFASLIHGIVASPPFQYRGQTNHESESVEVAVTEVTRP